MELAGIEIVLVQGCRIGQDVVGYRCRVFANGHVVGVYEIDVRLIAQSLEQRTWRDSLFRAIILRVLHHLFLVAFLRVLH